MSNARALEIYSAHAAALAQRYDSVTTDALLAGLADLIPPPPAPVLDIGAGSGRDAAWFLARGHAVTAAEPVAAFRDMIAARAPAATLSTAMLPELAGLSGNFGLILVNAVWHHLPPAARDQALQRITRLLLPEGRLFLWLRRGPVPPGQSLHEIDPSAEIDRAALVGLALLRSLDAPAHDAETAAAGIGWTRLALGKVSTR